MTAHGFRNLKVCNAALELALDIFEVSKTFPDEEKFGPNQIRRSSRATAAIVAEAYRKKVYPKAFVAKLVEADGENTETKVWLDICLRCKYFPKGKYDGFIQRSEEIGRMIGGMIKRPEKFSGNP